MLHRLHRLLSEARELGFLGPGPVEVQLDHARSFAEAAEGALSTPAPRSVADLGSGGGVPGLVLALRWEAASFLFVESHARRAAFLLRAVDELGLVGRVSVEAARAEAVGRVPTRRGAYDVVTARSFGRPGVVAECAAPLLEPGGLLVVSEPPPGSPDYAGRWPEEGLAQLGMGAAQPVRTEFGYVIVRQVHPCPSRFPRRTGVPAKRPLF
ncbi:MAG: 16S rRNA (guanine(527)-N(7))-methyltransferase RsmG [Acidimicrobiales bacterium]